MDAFAMTDTPPKNRPWFQLHLSTCVVLMVVAGALVWANVHNRTEMPDTAFPGFGEYGWPWRCYGIWYDSVDPETGVFLPFWQVEEKGVPHRALDFLNLALDLGMALILLGFVAFHCERRARRREAQEPAP